MILVLVGGEDDAGVTAGNAPSRPDAGTSAPVRQDQLGPVLLVPGYGGDTSAIAALAAELRSAGRTTRVLSFPDEGTGDLASYVEVLQVAAARELAAGAPSVDVVGYSAGGVVARLWAKQGGSELARRIVTLGSPHHGTQVAASAAVLAPSQCPQACQQLVPDSELLTDLNAGDETPGPQWLSLWTVLDQTVTPPESARLEGATNLALQDLCPAATTTHSELPRDRQVQGVVLAALGAGPLAVPTRCPG